MTEKEGRYLTYTDCKDMTNIVKQQISKIELIGFKRIIHKEIIDSGIQFEEKLTDLQVFLKSQKNQFFCQINPYNSSLSAIKVYHTLIDVGYKEDDSFIFLQLEIVNKSSDQVLEAFKSATFSQLLVIQFSKSDEKLNAEILLEFSSILQSNNNKKIVFIMTEENLLPDFLSNEPNFTTEKIYLRI
jgi:hypothetical protein